MIDKKRAGRIYETMVRIRTFEFKALKLFEENKLRGSVHLYIGEEAIAATVCSLLTDEDYITSTHRGHGHCIAKGAKTDLCMAELMGKATGYCKGRSGSMHIADFKVGNLGANAIVAGGIPMATGAALSAKMQGQDRVAVTFFGDGASNEGAFHEAMNLAGVMKLPIIFVCENNGFGISVPAWESTAVEHISVRGSGYNMPGETVDGNDPEAIDEVFSKYLERARKGEGPAILECMTYRWLGHWTGDPQPYRTREEIDDWKEKRDPIRNWRKKLIEKYGWTAEELDAIDAAAQAEIDAATEFALNSPEPDPAHVLDDVFFEGGDEA